MRDILDARRLAVVALAILATGCAGRLRAPEQLTPIGDTAFYANRVLVVVKQLREVAVEGEAAGAIAPEDAQRIVNATGEAGQAAVDLGRALRAGAAEETARRKWVAAIRSALTDLPDHLNEHTRRLVQPYISAVITLLSFFG